MRTRDPRLREDGTHMGRWLKLLGIVVAVAILLVVASQLVGGGDQEHGPQRHGLAVVVAT
jgi:hypothetical protein